MRNCKSSTRRSKLFYFIDALMPCRSWVSRSISNKTHCNGIKILVKQGKCFFFAEHWRPVRAINRLEISHWRKMVAVIGSCDNWCSNVWAIYSFLISQNQRLIDPILFQGNIILNISRLLRKAGKAPGRLTDLRRSIGGVSDKRKQPPCAYVLADFAELIVGRKIRARSPIDR